MNRFWRTNVQYYDYSWRREWQPTPVFLPGESHGQKSLAGYSSWGRKELDTTEWLSMHAFMTVVNNTLLSTWNLLEGWILRILTTCAEKWWLSEMTKMLISLNVVIIWQYLCVSNHQIVNLQFSSVAQSWAWAWFTTPWTAARQASLSITNSQSLPKPMSIVSVMPSNHLIVNLKYI